MVNINNMYINLAITMIHPESRTKKEKGMLEKNKILERKN